MGEGVIELIAGEAVPITDDVTCKGFKRVKRETHGISMNAL